MLDVALLGCGRWGTNHLRVLSELRDLELVRNITVVDTLSVSMGTGLIALEIAKSVKSGMKAADAVNYANELSEKGKIFVAVSTLEYLKKGGRINGAAALFGGILNVKPILTNVDGLVENWAKPRTMLRALSQIRDAAEGYVNIKNILQKWSTHENKKI